MNTHAMHAVATVIPTMRYRDAPAAIEWLCHAFGFEKHLVVPGENDSIVKTLDMQALADLALRDEKLHRNPLGDAPGRRLAGLHPC